MDKNIEQKIKDHALENPHRECCGFVVNDDIIRAHNLAVNHDKFFVSPLDIIKASKSGKIEAVYHSHISDSIEMSELDKRVSDGLFINYIIYSIPADKFSYYIPNKDRKSNMYIGREFVYGTSDCLTLIKDYYKNEFNITIQEKDEYKKRNFSWAASTPEIGLNMIKENPDFYKVNLSDWKYQAKQKYDIIVYKFKKLDVPSHVALFLGGGLILHQPRNTLSRIEEMQGDYEYSGNIYGVYRHKDCGRFRDK